MISLSQVNKCGNCLYLCFCHRGRVFIFDKNVVSCKLDKLGNCLSLFTEGVGSLFISFFLTLFSSFLFCWLCWVGLGWSSGHCNMWLLEHNVINGHHGLYLEAASTVYTCMKHTSLFTYYFYYHYIFFFFFFQSV